MSQSGDQYNFDWLPGFKEMMACQESEEEITDIPPQNPGMFSGKEDFSEKEMPEKTPLLPPEELQREEQNYWNDFEYMIRMLPSVAREIWAVADAILDKFEFEGSSMYAEYPDKNAVLKIADIIYEKLKYYECEQMESMMDGMEGKNTYYKIPEERGIHTPLRHLILVILCWNMGYRRQRYHRRKKIFPLS